MYRRRSQCCPGYFESGDLCVREYPLFNSFVLDDDISGYVCKTLGEKEEILELIAAVGGSPPPRPPLSPTRQSDPLYHKTPNNTSPVEPLFTGRHPLEFFSF